MKSRRARKLMCPMAALMSCCWSQALSDVHSRSAGLRSIRNMSKHSSQLNLSRFTVYQTMTKDEVMSYLAAHWDVGPLFIYFFFLR